MEVHGLDDLKRRIDLYSSKDARKSWPYYNELVADNVARLLDKLHSKENNGAALKLRTNGTSVGTLRLQYYQGARYLLDNKDPNKSYENLYKATKAITHKDLGYIELHIRLGFNLGEQLVTVTDEDWRTPMEDWLMNSSPGDKFYRNNLILTADDLAFISRLVEPLGKSLLKKVDQTSILLIKDIE